MKKTRKENIVLLILYIVLSLVLLTSIIFIAGANFEWGFVLQIERAIVKTNYDFDILVWSYWVAAISAVLLAGSLLIVDEVAKRKELKKVKHQYKF